MKTPRKSMQALDPGREYLVPASSIPPSSRSFTGRLFRGAGQVRAQLARTEGVVGLSLLARPWRKQYATLSVWSTSPPSLRSPARTRTAGSWPTWRRTWITGADGRPSWSEALGRLG